MPAFVCKKDFPLAGRAVMRPRLAGYAETSGLLMFARLAASRSTSINGRLFNRFQSKARKMPKTIVTEDSLHSR
jgi:hypothetical protein